jgi:hypothetical protein
MFGDAMYFGPEAESSNDAESDSGMIQSLAADTGVGNLFETLSFQGVFDKFLAVREAPVVVSKEITTYYNAEKMTDAYLLQFKHILLIRHPQKTISSFYRASMKPNSTTFFDERDLGFSKLQPLYERLRGLFREPESALPLVVESDDLVHSPESMRTVLQKVCDYLSIPFDANMISWDSQESTNITEWEKWKGWHDEVKNSTGFHAVEHPEMEMPERVKAAIQTSIPHYEALVQFAFKAFLASEDEM